MGFDNRTYCTYIGLELCYITHSITSKTSIKIYRKLKIISCIVLNDYI